MNIRELENILTEIVVRESNEGITYNPFEHSVTIGYMPGLECYSHEIKMHWFNCFKQSFETLMSNMIEPDAYTTLIPMIINAMDSAIYSCLGPSYFGVKYTSRCTIIQDEVYFEIILNNTRFCTLRCKL